MRQKVISLFTSEQRVTVLSRGSGRKRKGTGRATVGQVAERVGVSAITVSRYFMQPDKVSEALRERIAAAVAELGYVPNMAARGLATTHSPVVGMVIPNISGPIFANTIQSFSDAMNRHGYQLLLASSYFSAEQEEKALRAFLGWSPAGIVLTSHFHTEATERLIEQASLPIVETWDLSPHRKPIQVGFDHHDVGRLAATYLHDKGHRRIAFVQNSLAGDLSALERRDGYLEIMAERGLPPQVFAPQNPAPMEAGREAFEALLQGPDPARAIIFANDNLAAGAILAGQRAGIAIPGRCAVVGFGDYAMADKLLPSLTTIRPPAREIGEIAAQRILEWVGEIDLGDEAPRHLNPMPLELIVRESA